MKVESVGCSRYFVTFIDDFTKFISVHFIKSKAEVLEKFKLFEVMVSYECDEHIAKLRTDSGGEYVSKELKTISLQKELNINVPHHTRLSRTVLLRDLTALL